MASDTPRLPLAAVGGWLVIIIFCIFTLASVARYPVAFSPMDNWISDLGTALKNPAGDVYFNVGCILTGVAMLLMMAGLGSWRIKDKRKRQFMAVGRLCIGFAAFSLMLIGVFVEGTAYHGIFSLAFFLLLSLFLVFVNVALWKDPSYIPWLGYYAIVVVLIDLVFFYTYFAYEHAPVWEWLAVFSALIWVALLAYNVMTTKTR